ncbi:MAG TPA: ABC transporter permease [Nocardioides sp.]
MKGLAGTRTLTALALRRDRIMLPAWIAVFALVGGMSAAAGKSLYVSQADLETAGNVWNSSTALVAMYGRVYDVTSLGAVSLIKLTGMGAVWVALLTSMLVIRHTRADEEVGRSELAAGGVVGRYAPLTSALIIGVGTSVVLSAATSLAIAAGGLPVAGSASLGAAWAGAGIAFAAVAAVAAQLTTGARAARGLASTALAVAFVIRAVGDTAGPDGPRWISWFSPVGWAQQIRPFAGDRPWPLALTLVFTLVMAGVAVRLLNRRDLGAGLLADRAGPADAGRLLGSPLGLAWRLQRLALLGWTVGFVVLGFLIGSIATTIVDLLDNPRIAHMMKLLGGVDRLTDAFLSAELGFAAIFASAFGISAAMRMSGEEAQGRAESVLATASGRVAWAAAHMAVALFGTVVLVATVGLSAGVGYAVVAGDTGLVGETFGAALVRLPAVWVLTTLVIALYGLGRRLTVVAWVALVGFIVIGEFGPLMDLPRWTLDLSPYTHVPSLPGGDLEVAPLLWLTGVAAALLIIGLAGFRRRDLQPD